MSDFHLLQYLFDVQGYLVIEDALNKAEVATLNRLLDVQQLPAPGQTQRFGRAPDGPGFLEWGQPFCDLLDDQRIMPILRFRLGDCFRLDRIYGMYMQQGMPRGLLHADYGATSTTSRAQPGEYVPFRDDQIYNGFVVVTWCLTDTGRERAGSAASPAATRPTTSCPNRFPTPPKRPPTSSFPKRLLVR